MKCTSSRTGDFSRRRTKFKRITVFGD